MVVFMCLNLLVVFTSLSHNIFIGWHHWLKVKDEGQNLRDWTRSKHRQDNNRVIFWYTQRRLYRGGKKRPLTKMVECLDRERGDRWDIIAKILASLPYQDVILSNNQLERRIKYQCIWRSRLCWVLLFSSQREIHLI